MLIRGMTPRYLYKKSFCIRFHSFSIIFFSVLKNIHQGRSVLVPRNEAFSLLKILCLGIL